MSKPFATAIVNGAVYGHGDVEERVVIRTCTSRRENCVAQFYAPGWRAMAFRTVEAARAKIERHPGFVRWAV